MSTLQEMPPRDSERTAAPRTHEPQRRLHPPVRRIAVWGPLLAVTVLALLVIYGLWQRAQIRRENEQVAKENTAMSVTVATVGRDAKPRELTLPGNIDAFQETTLYARVNGYIAKRLVDIGDNVHEGQPLAEIETPEIDQQLAQARANFEIARITAQRWRDLVQKRVVAPQEFDEKEAAYEAAQAAVRQLEQTQGFKQIVAPFSGKITARNVDIGALVSAGGGTAGTALFSIAQTDPLRIYVNVPQPNVPSIREGLDAQILVQDMPGKNFRGIVTRTAGALDPVSRTMRVEVQIPNPDSVLYAGMYGQVKFTLKDDSSPVSIPANAFAFRPEGAQVATVTPDNRVHWQTIQVGRDFGTQMEATSGLAEGARVVVNPTDDLQEGMQVEVQAAPPQQSGQAGAQPSPQPQSTPTR